MSRLYESILRMFVFTFLLSLFYISEWYQSKSFGDTSLGGFWFVSLAMGCAWWVIYPLLKRKK